MAAVDADPTVVLRGGVVLPDRLLADGVVVLEADRVAWVGPAGQAPVPAPPPTADLLLPGLVDLHCHGGGGVGFPEVTGAAEARRAVAEHLAHGTTTLLTSLVTAPAADLLRRAVLLAGLAASGETAGVHVEGPFLAARRCGAQDPAHLVPGDPALVTALAEACDGHLVTMTVAPEVAGVGGPGGVLGALAAAGALPSFGHTDATAEECATRLAEARALLPGRRPTVTHLFNGMPSWHHRDPGPVPAYLAAAARGEAVVELVADGVHLAPATVRHVFDLLPDGAVVLVTDAMAAAGVDDGRYRLGGRDVVVRDGTARLVGQVRVPGPTGSQRSEASEPSEASDGALAGGTAHLLDVVRSTVAAGVPLVRAVHAAATAPAAVLGRADLGALEAGRRGDVVVVDADLRVRRVLRHGRQVTP